MQSKILVVENDQDILDIITIILEDQGYKVIASIYSSIIEDISIIQPDLIMLDHVVMNGSGSDICKEIKANPVTNNIPVILLSTAVGLQQITEDACADGFIEKPFDIDYLGELITDHLHRLA
ncbi:MULTISPECIES: response regulator transcription factor [Bacteria]